MKKVSKFFKQFDMFSAPSTLRARQQAQTSSLCAGVLSFIIAGIFTYIFIQNVVSIFQYGQITSTQTQTVHLYNIEKQKLSGDDVNAQNLLFGIMVNYMNWSQASKYFNLSITSFQVDQIYDIPLQQCQASQWKALGDDYETQFAEYGLGTFLCPSSSDNLDLMGTFKKTRIKQIKIALTPCTFVSNSTNSTTNSTTNTTNTTNSTTNTTNTTNTTTNTTNTTTNTTNQTKPIVPTNSSSSISSPNPLPTTLTTSTCLPNSNQTQFLSNIIKTQRSLLVQLYFLDSSYNVSAQNPISYFVNNDNRITFTNKRGVDTTVQFGSFQITTDTQVLPFTQYETINGNFVDRIQNNLFQINTIGVQPYVVFTILMGRRMIQIQRTVGKLDQTLSYVGGLFSIIIGFLAFFMMSFNQYRYQIMIAQSTFNYDMDGKKIKQQQFMFHDYIKYSIYDWINTLFMIKLNWKSCKQIDQTRQQVICQMDVVRLFRKIRNLQTAILYLISQKQRNCLSLYEPPCLEQVRRNRLINQYYDVVLGGQPAVTVEDIQMVGQTLKIGLHAVEKIKKKNKNDSDNDKYDDGDGSSGNRQRKYYESSQRIYQKNQNPINKYNQNYNYNQNFNNSNSNNNNNSHNNLNNINNQKVQKQFSQFQIQLQKQQTIKIAADRSNVLDIVLNNFPQFAKQADAVKLPQELESIEEQIAQSFFGMKLEQRLKIQEKIPLKIIHRLKKRMGDVMAKTAYHIDLSN